MAGKKKWRGKGFEKKTKVGVLNSLDEQWEREEGGVWVGVGRDVLRVGISSQSTRSRESSRSKGVREQGPGQVGEAREIAIPNANRRLYTLLVH